MSGKSRRNFGKKMAEGSYGCIYTDDKKVLKVSDKSEAEVELKIADIIKSIPNWQSYYIIQEKEEFQAANFTRIRPMYQGDCKIIRQTTNSNLRLLSSPYGGVPVRSIEVTETFSYDAAVLHLLEAVTKLNAQGVCHFDIHTGNVVDDINGVMRIIDFGSAFLGDFADVAIVKKHKYPFSPNFSPQPPELAIQNAIVEKREIQTSIEAVLESREVFRNSAEYTGITKSYARSELFNFVTNEYHSTDIAWAEYFRTYWRKWDIWSVGILLLRLLQQCLFLPALKKDLWDNVYMRKKIQTLLKGCLEPDPRKRLSAKDALNAWISFSSNDTFLQ